MSFNKIWDFFTYIFRIFKRDKRDKRPEYTKVFDDHDDVDIEIEFGKLNDSNLPHYSFVILRK